MQRRGIHSVWVLWTSDENADKIYGRFGFKETRRFAVMRRPL
jgi:mycothiol synthase